MKNKIRSLTLDFFLLLLISILSACSPTKFSKNSKKKTITKHQTIINEFKYFDKKIVEKVKKSQKEFPNHSFWIDGTYTYNKDSIDITYFVKDLSRIEEQLFFVESIVDTLDAKIKRCEKYIDLDFNKKGVTYEHLEWFLDGFNKDDFLQWGLESTNSKEQLILAAKEKLEIANVYFHEIGTKEGEFITIDYSVGGYSCDEYIAIMFNLKGELIEFTTED